jgi:SAM-dependent methyltransferase
MAAFRRVYEDYLVVEDIYPELARRFLSAGVTRFAEIGGGRGPTSAVLAAEGVDTVVIDLDAQMLAEAHRPAVGGDLRALPLANNSVDGVAAVNTFYFLDDPVVGITEAWRILQPGGTFVASSPSQWNDPELEGIDPKWGTATTFDSEAAPDLVAQVFGAVEVEPWSIVAYELPDRGAIADYLHAFNIEDWQRKAATIDTPLTITKRGAQVWARKISHHDAKP